MDTGNLLGVVDIDDGVLVLVVELVEDVGLEDKDIVLVLVVELVEDVGLLIVLVEDAALVVDVVLVEEVVGRMEVDWKDATCDRLSAIAFCISSSSMASWIFFAFACAFCDSFTSFGLGLLIFFPVTASCRAPSRTSG